MTSKNILIALITIYSVMNTACSPKATSENTSNNAAEAAVEVEMPADAPETADDANEFNPFAPEAAEQIESFDKAVEETTNESTNIPVSIARNNCTYGNRFNCGVYAQVVKNRQEMYLYVGGRYQATWKVSTGREGFRTPNFETHPNGRIYNRYSSITFPGGDYNGLGNMPYAVFISGGFAFHGTPQGNWGNLGRPASHGCIRLHPDNAWRLNNLIRQYGVSNTWVTVQDKLDSDR